MGRIVTTLLVVLALAACEPRGHVVLDPAAAKTSEVETVFVGSSRARDPETGEIFSRNRTEKPRYARLDIAIPPDRQPGKIVWPRPHRPVDPTTEFVATKEVIYASSTDFRADLSAAIRREQPGQREAIIYIHGFNANFAEGVYRLAQLGHDLNLKAVLVHYSWPSRGHPLGYAYDRDSALFSRDGLEELLEEVEAAGAERILIIAHSMGSALTMEALRQIAIEGNRDLLRHISGVALMSPDIDTDVFHAQATRIGKLPQPFIIFTSKRDRALALAARLTGQRDRLGNIEDVRKISDLKVTLLDTTAFSSGLGHFDVGSSPALIAILGQIGDVDAAFAGDRTGRTGLIPGAVLTVQSATQIVLAPVTALSGALP